MTSPLDVPKGQAGRWAESCLGKKGRHRCFWRALQTGGLSGHAPACFTSQLTAAEKLERQSPSHTQWAGLHGHCVSSIRCPQRPLASWAAQASVPHDSQQTQSDPQWPVPHPSPNSISTCKGWSRLVRGPGGVICYLQSLIMAPITAHRSPSPYYYD